MQQISKNVSNIFTEKNPHITGSVQFKPVLFKGQLYIRRDAAKGTNTNTTGLKTEDLLFVETVGCQGRKKRLQAKKWIQKWWCRSAHQIRRASNEKCISKLSHTHRNICFPLFRGDSIRRLTGNFHKSPCPSSLLRLYWMASSPFTTTVQEDSSAWCRSCYTPEVMATLVVALNTRAEVVLLAETKAGKEAP